MTAAADARPNRRVLYAGVVRDGGPADFVLVHGDPVSDPAALWRVWRVSWAPDPIVV